MSPICASSPLRALALANLRNVALGPDIVEYLERIDATLAPFGGRFLVHGGAVVPLEGQWPGTLVVIGFPDRASAEAWYASPAYRAILPLRLGNCEGEAIIVETVPDDHRAPDVLAA